MSATPLLQMALTRLKDDQDPGGLADPSATSTALVHPANIRGANRAFPSYWEGTRYMGLKLQTKIGSDRQIIQHCPIWGKALENNNKPLIERGLPVRRFPQCDVAAFPESLFYGWMKARGSSRHWFWHPHAFPPQSGSLSFVNYSSTKPPTFRGTPIVDVVFPVVLPASFQMVLRHKRRYTNVQLFDDTPPAPEDEGYWSASGLPEEEYDLYTLGPDEDLPAPLNSGPASPSQTIEIHSRLFTYPSP